MRLECKFNTEKDLCPDLPPHNQPSSTMKQVHQKNYKKLAFECYYVQENKKDAGLALIDSLPTLVKRLKRFRKSRKHLKFQLGLKVEFCKLRLETDEHIRVSPWFTSKMETLFAKDNIKDIIEKTFSHILDHLSAYTTEGSGWILRRVLMVKLTVNRYKPYKGGGAFSKLPKAIQQTHAVISFDCADNKCFLYGIAVVEHKLNAQTVRNKKRLQKYIMQYKIKGISFPTPISDIEKFELQNKISVNVFSYIGSRSICPLWLTCQRRFPKHVNLLLYKNHYYAIRNMSRLLHGFEHPNEGHKRFYCDYCLVGIVSKKSYREHVAACKEDGKTFRMPAKDLVVKFKEEDYHKKVRADFVWFLDIETYNNATNAPTEQKTVNLTEQIPYAFCLIRWCSNPLYEKPPYIYIGTDAITHLFDYLEKELCDVGAIIDKVAPQHLMKYTKEEIKEFKAATHCYLCKLEFSKFPFVRKLKDHSHVEMKYRGALCNRCNLNYASSQKSFDVFAHNSSRFICHMVNSGMTIHPFE